MARGKRISRSARVERFDRGKVRPGLLRRSFTRFASAASSVVGSHWAFIVAFTVVLVWLVTGPIFNFSSEWQLIINTISTISTGLIVFVIQNTVNRDSKAIHLKLDELLRAVPSARQEFMEAEEEDLQEILREKRIVDEADPAPPRNGEASKRDRTKERRAG